MPVKSKYDRRIVIGPVRISYPNLFTPRAMAYGDELKYSVCLLISKGDVETLEKIKQAVSRAQISGVPMWGGVIPDKLKLPLRDGDLERGDQEEFMNHFFINAVSRELPRVVNRKREDIFDPREVYAGCYCNVSISIYPFNDGDFKGVGCGIINVQKAAEGQLLTMRTTPDEDFEIIYNEEEILT